MRPSSPRSSRISSTTARYSRSSSRVLDGRRGLVGALLDLDAQAAVRVGLAAPAMPRCSAESRTAADAAGQAEPLADLGDHADVGVVVAVPRDEEDAGSFADVDRQGHVHAGEDDGVVECDQFERSMERNVSTAGLSIDPAAGGVARRGRRLLGLCTTSPDAARIRHSRESGNPSDTPLPPRLDARFRGHDGCCVPVERIIAVA